MLQAPLTIRQQLEAWLETQPPANRQSALENARLDRLYEIILEEDGELSPRAVHSLTSPRIQRKLLAVGIDVDATWVATAKYVVDPRKDWFPQVKSRNDVIELFRPYFVRAGGAAALSRMFFGGRAIESLFRRSQERLPGMDLLVALLQFCVDDEREGGQRKQWDTARLFFMEGQWNVFGRGKVPIPELTGQEEFNAWFCDHVLHEQVDHVANKLNRALGTEAFSAPLLIAWRNGSTPSREKYEALLRGIQHAFPDWLNLPQSSIERQPGDQSDKPPREPTPAAPKAPRTPVPQASVPQASTPQAPAQPTLASILSQAAEALARLAKQAESLAPAPSDVAGAAPSTATDPGEVVNGFRFVLTEASFRRPEVFSLDEVEDTEQLLKELSRRQALINSLEPTAKRSVMRRLRHAFNEYFIQVRHLDVDEEDLPAMFREMQLVASQLSGHRLES